MHREVICHATEGHLSCIKIIFTTYWGIVRKQPCKGWSVGRAGLASETSLPCLSDTPNNNPKGVGLFL